MTTAGLRGISSAQRGLKTVPFHHVLFIASPIHSFKCVAGTFVRWQPILRNTNHRVTRNPIQPRAFSSSTTTAMAKSSDNQEGSRPSAVTATRPATLADAPTIADLAAHVFTVTFGHSVEPHELQAFLDESYSLDAITRDLEDPNRDTVLATDPAGDVLGFAMLTRGSKEPCVAHLEATVELQRIYLYPKAHGTGAGKLLADRLEDMAREQGFKHIWLGVWEENYRARKAYEKWGYRACGNHDFVVGSVVQTDDIMVKKL
ncbi:Acetyltransferase [Colletotrichum higginsianum IMI 349063]|uniref:Acetyltransferase n=2 Tax=Colletotrichum higginsianum TaxID=80884 RepID=A0A1B7YLC6_COLHI|nr:Acetyltransferase [Colletotrichum higginsianum IMI 349063]OBR12847.1 Acetyltransferase [Colletotrichum higginsianum IMI 349063]